MRPAIWIGLLAGFMLAAAVPARATRVVGVIDGDRLQVQDAGSVRTVHVAGVDAPNAARPKKGAEYFGAESVDYTQKNWLGQEVRLAPAAAPSEVYVEMADGKDLGTELVRQGLAYVQPGCGRCKDLQGVERKARGTFAGLWHPAAYRKFQVAKNTKVQYMGTLGERRSVKKIASSDGFDGEEVWVIFVWFE
jgi:endonuclease YncB( thermonuclease family)